MYASKVKNAQEAHEAIRPSGDHFRTPEQVARDGLSRDEQRLYDLVWKRTVASQMKDATGESVSVRVAGTSSAGENAEFGASGNVIKFYGFLKAYVEGADDPNADRDDRERRLPPLAENDPLAVLRLEAAEHATRPPARYTEASLVKELEDREIGRAVDVRVDHRHDPGPRLRVQEGHRARPVLPGLRRGHAAGAALRPARGLRVHRADGRRARRDRARRGVPCAVAAPVLLRRRPARHGRQPDGDGANGAGTVAETGLKALVSDIDDIDPREVSSFPLDGTDITVRVGRYGPYLERDGQRVNVPEDMAPDELTPERAEELFSQPNEDVVLGTDPGTGLQVVAKIRPVRPVRDRAARPTTRRRRPSRAPPRC